MKKNNKALYEQIMKTVSKLIKTALNENELEETSEYIEDETIRLELELYRANDNSFGIWLSDDMGGSGIEVEENTPESAGEEIGKYIADYFYRRDDEDDEE